MQRLKVIFVFVLVLIGDALWHTLMAGVQCGPRLRHWIGQCWQYANKYNQGV